jgi:hypothetical protein
MKGRLMIVRGLRCLLIAATAAASFGGEVRADFVPVNGLADLILWAGSGEHEAAFVLQFSAAENPTAVAWGYRWSGSATVQDMMFAIAGGTTVVNGSAPPPGLDERLAVVAQFFTFGDSGGFFVNSITYDQLGLPAPWTQAGRQIEDDYFISGTYPVFYFKADAGGSFGSPSMEFSASNFGISDLSLVSGGWYGFVQGSGSETFSFTQPVAAVPEPGTWALAAAAGAAVAAARLRRRVR